MTDKIAIKSIIWGEISKDNEVLNWVNKGAMRKF